MVKTKGSADISEFIHGRVISLFEKGLSYQLIADECGISKSSARNIVIRGKKGQTKGKSRPGAELKLTADVVEQLKSAVTSNRRFQLMDLSSEYQLSGLFRTLS